MGTHLVEYSSSDEEKSERLELPSAIQALDSDRLRFFVHEDDPSRHNFRIRSFPHETGNWATCIYISCPDFHSQLLEVINDSMIQLNLIISDFHFMDSLHLSLSKTWPIYFHWIEKLVCNLRSSISTFEKFYIAFNNLDILINEEGTRSFVTLVASKESHTTLVPLLNSVSSCVTAFRGPEYYKDPKFHISFLWFNGNVREKYSEEVLNNLLLDLKKSIFSERKQIYHKVTDIVCKAGNKHFDICLL
ncbi:unnamed protein product [Heterobilharzia americana]|nr:unnamed protein product [Heterobilharzia americana]